MAISGRATDSGTAAYAQRFTHLPGHFRPFCGVLASSLGLGTYLGDDSESDDAAYARAITVALLGGINVIDSAINYRFQRSEKVIGRVVGDLVRQQKVAREEVIIATKGGFVPFNGNPRLGIEKHFIRTGLSAPDDWVAGCHCIAPKYIEAMVETSRQNLGLETIDIYYLHNPEIQLEAVDRAKFMRRMRAAFEVLEKKVAQGEIGVYGTATWAGYRADPDEPGYLSLAELVKLAEEVAGAGHHFKVIQLPYNLVMLEALGRANQRVDSKVCSVLEAAEELGIGVCVSAPLLQGRLARGLPSQLVARFAGLSSHAQCALQFVRSTPGVDVALVGMKSERHVLESLELAKRPPLSEDEFATLFSQ